MLLFSQHRARSSHFVDQHNDLNAWKKKDKELERSIRVTYVLTQDENQDKT